MPAAAELTWEKSRVVRSSARRERVVATIDPRLFGSFLEHLGRATCGCVFEPGSTLADQDGFVDSGLQLVGRRDDVRGAGAISYSVIRLANR
jgi:hypothetical protein